MLRNAFIDKRFCGKLEQMMKADSMLGNSIPSLLKIFLENPFQKHYFSLCINISIFADVTSMEKAPFLFVVEVSGTLVYKFS